MRKKRNDVFPLPREWSEKMLLRMKLTLVLVCCLFLQSFGIAYAQSISLKKQNASLEEIIWALKEKTKLNFLYSNEDVAGVKGINIDVENAQLDMILKQCLSGTDLLYVEENNAIIIRRADKEVRLPQQKIWKVVGTVHDEKGQPLPGVAILVEGTTVGVTTDIDGKYAIECPYIEGLALRFSFIGMKTERVVIGDKTELNVVMKVDVKEMEEVVVTGYGNIRKSSYTGNVVQVKQEDLLKVSRSNIISALQSFDPSLRISTNNEWGSDPNTLPEFYIRGRSGIVTEDLSVATYSENLLSKSSLENNPNIPTFIVDGFETDMENIYDMDPTRIESITILKDAAATAMYGSRAANGVIVITTVAPKSGEFRLSYSFTGALTMPDLSDYNLANAEEKLEIERLAGIYNPIDETDFANKQKQYYARYKRILEGVDTDWMKIPVQTVFNHMHSLFLEGGSEEMRIGLRFGYNNEDGVMKKSKRDRYSIGLILGYNLSNLQIRNEVSFSRMNSKDSPYGLFSDFVRMLPYDRVYDELGNIVKELEFTRINLRIANNPLYEATLGNYTTNQYNELQNNLSLNWNITKALAVKASFGINMKYSDFESFIDPLSTKSTILASEDSSLAGNLALQSSRSVNWDSQLLLLFNNNYDRHYINLTAGFNATSNTMRSESSSYQGFPSGDMHSSNSARKIVSKPSKSSNYTRLFGFVGNLNYTYDNIYLLDMAVRIDGSSEFGKNQKFAPFWSAGIGLNIHNYDFFPENKILTLLKIRGSYGQTGKTNFEPYVASTMYEPLDDDWYVAGGYGVKMMALGNPDLKWERTNILDVGFDSYWFNQRLALNVSYYNRLTVDMITDVTVPSSSGFYSYKDNMGEIVNRGVEVFARLNVFSNENVMLDVWGNAAHNKNEIKKISESLKRYNDEINDYYQEAENNRVSDEKYSKTFTKYVEGGSVTSIFGVRSLGIDPTNGKEMFLTKEGNLSYEWKAEDQVIIGNTEPKLQGSFGINFRYKNLSLFTSFMYAWGGQEYNYTLVNKVENADVQFQNVDKRVLYDRWQNVGDITPLKDIKNRDQSTLPTSRFVQDNNYLSLSAITLGYDLKSKQMKKMGLSLLRFEMSMNDIGYFSSILQERGTSYPYSRTVNLSIKANF